MNKIVFKSTSKDKKEADAAPTLAEELEAVESEAEEAKKIKAAKKPAPLAEEEAATATDSVASVLPPSAETQSGEEIFNKQKIIKYFKRHPKKAIPANVERFNPNIKKGLSEAQVQARFTQFLFNDTNKNYSRSYASIFIGNICTFFNLLCLLAAIALFIAGTKGITNYLVIFITITNIGIGIIQEIRSKLSIDKLSILASNSIKTIRDGEITDVPVNEIVMDDIIILELGNQVPADCILAEGSVEVNESLLTGESISIKKNVGDTLYAGSFISSGSGKFRVDKVGKETYLEKLTSKAKKYKKPKSELMNSTKLIIKAVSFLIFPIGIWMFFVAKADSVTIPDTITDFLFPANINYAIQRTCSVVIGMIPSGMLLLTSLALALGIIRLAKNQTLVQDMYSLEMLARVNVLCLDKTGTITDGRMRVNDCVILNTVENYSLNDIMGSMLAALNDNNQTSIALHNHFGISTALSPTATIPFSSKIKLSAASFEDVGTFVMGAPEFVLKPYPTKVEKIVKSYAQMGLRVIVLAHSTVPIVGDKLPTVLKPIAIISIADNIREDAIETIAWFKNNDVNVKVISGDNPVTVCEVAKRAGIQDADKYISLEGLNEKEVENVANKYAVFGRVTPEQKAVLVRAIKAAGNTVAMTGDGVNDILALKEADCAISVASGSEAARNVSHIVLMDNNFNNMPKVVAEGRRVINNIKNSSSLYLMKTLFTAMLAIIFCAMREAYIFMPKNVLLLEFAIIAIPSFFLSLQPNNERVRGKFITHVMSGAFAGALTMLLCVMAMYVSNVANPEEFGKHYKAMCMIALTFSGLVMVFRISKPLNVYRAVMCVSVLAVTIVCYAIPIVGNMFYDSWDSLKWDYAKILIIVVVIEAAFPVSGWITELMHIILPSSTGKSKRKEDLN